MKTLELAQLGLEELSTTDLINNHGGGDSTSLGNIGSIIVTDLVDINGNELMNGNYLAFSGNTTNTGTSSTTGFNFSFSR
ncbi:hypothetical protein ACAW74_17100 [Fibrella sp. WM1]|uniref:hypothetical protein n=1 Tax=Fibrella musci TaxID=3242485 RepID=UPI0035207BE5